MTILLYLAVLLPVTIHTTMWKINMYCLIDLVIICLYFCKILSE
jgi:hypothetical protein